MVKQLLWKNSKDSNPGKIKSNRGRKRTALEIDTISSSKSSKRPSKRLRRNTRLRRRKVRIYNIRNRKLGIVDPNIDDDLSDFISQKSLTLRWKGLLNLGNSCYFNSVLQCLYHCPTFKGAIETVTLEALSIAVVKQLQMLFVDMGAVSHFDYINPTKCLTAAMNIPKCKRAGMKVNGPQQDAGEFLVHLLEHLEEKWKSLSDIFEGEFVSTHTCQHCFYTIIKHQPFKLFTLQMDLPSMLEIKKLNLYKLMNYFQRATILDGYGCPYCRTQNSTQKEITLNALPRVLVIVLSRFRGLIKLDKYVGFPAQLSIKYTTDENEYNAMYRIMGIVVHIGPSIASGHYIAYVRSEEKWFKMNDNIVSEVRWETVRSKEAYLIMYEQM